MELQPTLRSVGMLARPGLGSQRPALPVASSGAVAVRGALARRRCWKRGALRRPSGEHGGAFEDCRAARAARGLVVGQAPPRPPGALPPGYLPLQGGPEKRLARLAGLASPEELWTAFDRVDLIGWCPGPKSRKPWHLRSNGYRKHHRDGHRFPMREARLAAGRLVRFGFLARDYDVVVLCGRLVALAFGLKSRAVPWTEELGGVRYLVLPHPSGASHFWNDELSWHRAALRAARIVPRAAAAGGAGAQPGPGGQAQVPSTPDVPAPRGSCRPAPRASPRAVRSRFFTGPETGEGSQHACSASGSTGGALPPCNSEPKGGGILADSALHARALVGSCRGNLIHSN